MTSSVIETLHEKFPECDDSIIRDITNEVYVFLLKDSDSVSNEILLNTCVETICEFMNIHQENETHDKRRFSRFLKRNSKYERIQNTDS